MNDSSNEERTCVASRQPLDCQGKAFVSPPPVVPQNEQLGETETAEGQGSEYFAHKGQHRKPSSEEAPPTHGNDDHEQPYHTGIRPPPATATPTSSSTLVPIGQITLEPLPLPSKQSDCLKWKKAPGSRPGASAKSSQRSRLLVFVKIILKCLDSEDPSLRTEAKQIITDCTRKNREGVPGYDPLADAITSQLRTAVGEVHWNRAESLMNHYLRRRNDMKMDRPKYYAAV